MHIKTKSTFWCTHTVLGSGSRYRQCIPGFICCGVVELSSQHTKEPLTHGADAAAHGAPADQLRERKKEMGKGRGREGAGEGKRERESVGV